MVKEFSYFYNSLEQQRCLNFKKFVNKQVYVLQ